MIFDLIEEFPGGKSRLAIAEGNDPRIDRIGDYRRHSLSVMDLRLDRASLHDAAKGHPQ